MSSRLTDIKTVFIVFLTIGLVFLAYLPAVHAASEPLVIVEVFKEDRVHLDIGDTTHVIRTLVIENRINKSIVPGMITLILQKQSPDKLGPIAIPGTGSVKPVNATNVTAKLGDGTAISDVRVTEAGNSTVIQYGAWVPIGPGQTLTVVLEYDSPDIVEKGLLFNTVDYPFTSSSIPVEKAIVEATIQTGQVTYSSQPPAVSGRTYVWEKPQLAMGSWDVPFEYSILPLPLLPIRGGALVWGLILLICLVWVAWTYARPRKKA